MRVVALAALTGCELVAGIEDRTLRASEGGDGGAASTSSTSTSTTSDGAGTTAASSGPGPSSGSAGGGAPTASASSSGGDGGGPGSGGAGGPGSTGSTGGEGGGATTTTSTGGDGGADTTSSGGSAAGGGGATAASSSSSAESSSAASTANSTGSGGGGGGGGGCSALPAQPSDVYVDRTHQGEATGTPDCPFPTMTEGVARLGASGSSTRRLHVAAGLYESTGGETLPLQVVGPMEILGAGAGSTVLRGLGYVADHDGTLGPSQVAMVVRSLPGKVVVRGMRLLSPKPAPELVDLGIACLDGNAPALAAETEGELPEAAFELDEAAVDGFFSGLTVSSTAIAGCNALVTRSSFSRNKFGVWLVGEGSFDSGPFRLPVARIGRPGEGNVFEEQLAGVIVNPAGIAAWNRTGGLVAEDNTFLSNFNGIHLTWTSAGLGGRTPFVRIDGNRFDQNQLAGVLLYQVSTVTELLDNDFLGTVDPGYGIPAAGVALHSFQTRVDHARGNRFVGNDRGVLFLGTNLSDPPAFSDFGTAGDPGANEFRCNSRLGNPLGGDVVFASTPTTPFAFEGNAWDRVPPDVRRAGNASEGDDVRLDTDEGIAPSLEGATLGATACPPGKVP